MAPAVNLAPADSFCERQREGEVAEAEMAPGRPR